MTKKSKEPIISALNQLVYRAQQEAQRKGERWIFISDLTKLKIHLVEEIQYKDQQIKFYSTPKARA